MGFAAGALGWVAVGLAAAGTAVATYSAARQGQIADETAKYNAKLAEREALQKRNLAAAAADDAKERHRRTLATQLTKYGASGVTSEGSPLAVMLQSEEEAALDVARIKAGGREAGVMLETEARQLRYSGKQARAHGYLGAGSTLLQGAANTYGVYTRTRTPSSPYASGSAWGSRAGGGDG